MVALLIWAWVVAVVIMPDEGWFLSVEAAAAVEVLGGDAVVILYVHVKVAVLYRR